jgi:hypothetical protein
LVGAGGGVSGAVVSCVGLSPSCSATSSTVGTFFVASALACGVGRAMQRPLLPIHSSWRRHWLVALAPRVAVLDIGAAKG